MLTPEICPQIPVQLTSFGGLINLSMKCAEPPIYLSASAVRQIRNTGGALRTRSPPANGVAVGTINSYLCRSDVKHIPVMRH